jgi:CheY-like chemotaxis protein
MTNNIKKVHGGRMRKFICIDDDPVVLYLNRYALNKSGICSSLTLFINALEALEHLETYVPDSDERTVIICDYMMPLMTGLEFVEEFEKFPVEKKEHFLIVILSSTLTPDVVEKSKRFPTVVWDLVKPLDVKKLENILV